MKKLFLDKDGNLQIWGFANYQQYQPYKNKAAESSKVLFYGKPEWSKPMQRNSWVVQELRFSSPGSTKWYNYKLGVGHALATQQESFDSVLEALEQPEYIIVFKK